MSNINKILDAELKKDWHKNFRINSIIIAVTALFFMLILAYFTGDFVEKEAEVVSFYSEATETSESYYIISKLKTGVILKIKIPRELHIKKGDKVILKEHQTNLFGFKRYSFFKFNAKKGV